MGDSWLNSETMSAALVIGTSGCAPASESMFTPCVGEIELVGLYCHGDRTENPEWRQVTCGENRCQKRLSLARTRGKAWLPYYDIRMDDELWPHVMLTILKRQCPICDAWHEETHWGRFCGAACKHSVASPVTEDSPRPAWMFREFPLRYALLFRDLKGGMRRANTPPP